ncbi:MAG: hypothetical protein ACSHYF_11075 [Verrucomicrobiaceae bacterium]
MMNRVDGLRRREELLEFVQAAGGEVAFLRFEVAGLEQREDSDWDVAVRDGEAMRRVAGERYGKPLLEVRRQYVEQRYYEWGQLDFLPVFEWNGFCYLGQERFWGGVSTGEDGIPRPRVGHDGFVVWMTGLLWGGVYNERYDGLLKEAVEGDGEEFRECLVEVFGEALGGELYGLAEAGDFGGAVEWVGRMRWKLALGNVGRDGADAIFRVVSHWRVEWGHHWDPPFPWVAFLGPDGSGKSTVIDGVKERFRRSRIGIKHVHWRPKLRGGDDDPGMVVDDPHGAPQRGKLVSLVALVLLVLRWWAGLVCKIWHVRAKKAMMLSDRYYLDLLADSRRYRFGLPLWCARWAFGLIPRPQFTMVLLTDAETILARKAEVPKEELERQLVAYRELAESMGERACVLDVSRSPEVVIGEAFEKITGVMRG